MKFLLWFGMSQTGKSSAISLLTGDKSIECGKYGKGSSTTSEVKVYKDSLQNLPKDIISSIRLDYVIPDWFTTTRKPEITLRRKSSN